MRFVVFTLWFMQLPKQKGHIRTDFKCFCVSINTFIQLKMCLIIGSLKPILLFVAFYSRWPVVMLISEPTKINMQLWRGHCVASLHFDSRETLYNNNSVDNYEMSRHTIISVHSQALDCSR